MGSQLILLFCLLSTIIQFTSAYSVTLPNKTEHQNWKFSRHHPIHHFSSVLEIPLNYLPIKVSSIPNRQGVWVLRHKDFSGAPEYFPGSRAEASENTATIKYDTSFQLFENVTIKILAYGKPEFQVKFPGTMKQGLSILEPDNLKNCTGGGGIEREDLNGPPKWMTFQIQIPPTSRLVLEAAIRHDHSFLIIDEVIIDYGEGASRDHHEDHIKTIKDINVSCAINLAN